MSDGVRQEPTRETRQLLARLDTLETLVLRGTAVVAATLLTIGQLIPYVTATFDDERVSSSMLTLGFRSVAYRNADGEGDAFTTLSGVGYLGLSALTVALVALLLTVVWWRSGEDRSRRWSAVVGGLLLLGTVVQWLVVVIGSTRRAEWDVHAGALVFTVGVAVGTAVVLVADLRRLWLRP